MKKKIKEKKESVSKRYVDPMIIEILKKNQQGIRLDVGCGANKQLGFVGMDYRKEPGVDIVHDLEKFPWPLPNECASLVMASHVVEHINPHGGVFIAFMNEVWRILKPDGEFLIAAPYATSQGMFRDPTHCLVDGAEVLTKDGFKKMQDVKIGEEVLTMNLETEETEYSKCIGIVNEDYEGLIVRFENRAVNIAVTPNHDMISKWRGNVAKWEKRRADSFFEKTPFGRVGIATIPKWIGDEPDTVEIKKTEGDNGPTSFNAGDFMDLLGWILSEGCFTTPNGQDSSSRFLKICQSKAANLENYNKISSLVGRMGFESKEYENYIRINSKSLFDHLSYLGKQDVRYIPVEYKGMSVLLLERLLESLRMGDGEWHNNERGYTYTTISERLASDVNEIALKCGFRSHIYLREGKEFFSPVRDKSYVRKDQYRVSVCPLSEKMLYPKPFIEQYDGKIVCVKVEKNHTILTRYNGHVAWVGNCNFVNEETWSYFDPIDKWYKNGLYSIYRPLPWNIKFNTWHENGNIEVVLIKRRIDPSYNVDSEFLKILK